MEFLNPYIIRARLFPAMLGIAPAVALLALSITAEGFAIPQAIGTATLGVLFFTFSNIARRLGKGAERKLFSDNDGYPRNRTLHRNDPTFDEVTKNRYRQKLASLCEEEAPTAEQEASDPASADAYYKRAFTWLRENTRSHDEFRVLFEENVTYGFWRNLYGIKWSSLVLNGVVVAICIGLLYWREFSPAYVQTTVMVALIATVHAAFFLVFVGKKAVLEASDQYARQLLLAVERLKVATKEATAA